MNYLLTYRSLLNTIKLGLLSKVNIFTINQCAKEILRRDTMNSSNKSAMVTVMLVVGLVLGGGIGYAIGHHAKSTMSSGTDTAMSSNQASGTYVGGALMVDNKNIVANALNANNVTTLVKAVQAAGLVNTLEGSGPFTVFAPNNSAFAKLPSATLNSLLQPANKAELTKILTYHVVSGTYTSAALRVMAEKGQTLTTVEGEQLSPVLQNGQIELKDAQGNLVTIQTPDVISSNGVTFVINSVLMP
jgi:uncharacterized surface protein with fasciclin (FAS1) repeats